MLNCKFKFDNIYKGTRKSYAFLQRKAFFFNFIQTNNMYLIFGGV